MQKIKSLFSRETLLYIIFGALTTLINYVVFFLCYSFLLDGRNSVFANVIAFVVAVIFAFFVNKLYVFDSKSWSFSVLKKEIPSFLAARIGSFLIEELGLFVSEQILRLNEVQIIEIFGIVIDGVTVVKLVLAVIVVIINFIFCKLFIFKKIQVE